MTSIAERLFPESDEPQDILLGMPDITHGQAAAFLAALSSEDREIVQHYVTQGILPSSISGIDIEDYVCDLAKGYAIVDPTRSSLAGVSAAVAELERAKRYAEVFIGSGDFFPVIRYDVNDVIDDSTGEIETVDTLVWDEYRTGSVTQYDSMKSEVRDKLLPYIDEAISFIQVPAAGWHFNQTAIIKRYKESLAADQESLQRSYDYRM